MPQTTLDLEIKISQDAKKIVDALEQSGKWMRVKELSAITELHERTIRRLIVEVLRPKGIIIISGQDGYKLAATSEEVVSAVSEMGARVLTGAMNYAAMKGISLSKAFTEIRGMAIGKALS
jgi:DNA-binding IclR family transcriptional regulator